MMLDQIMGKSNQANTGGQGNWMQMLEQFFQQLQQGQGQQQFPSTNSMHNDMFGRPLENGGNAPIATVPPYNVTPPMTSVPQGYNQPSAPGNNNSTGFDPRQLKLAPNPQINTMTDPPISEFGNGGGFGRSMGGGSRMVQ